MRDAGFSQVMLKASDLVGHPEGVDDAVGAIKASGLRVTGFQVLRDFEGLSGHLHDYKVDIAKSMLEMTRARRCRRCCWPVRRPARTPRRIIDALARDLRKLAMLAVPLGIKIAYEGLSWGRTINEFTTAWEVVSRADAPNLGLGIDSFHIFAAKTPLDGARHARREQDLPRAAGRLHVAGGAHLRGALGHRAALSRLFPARGVHSEQVAELVTRLDALGYRGDYSFEVFNDDYQQIPLARRGRARAPLGTVARRSRCCAARYHCQNAMRLRKTRAAAPESKH